MSSGRPEWMKRSHADYDPNRIGEISQARVIAALVEAGKFIYVPLGQAGRSDLIFEDERGELCRVQCKTGHLLKGAIIFPTQSLRAARRETEWKRVARDYQGQIDYFGVYCPDNGKVYLVPIGITSKRSCSLRLEATRNGQRKRLRWAREFELFASPECDLFSTIEGDQGP
jgi:hypothetical protein